MREYHFPLLSNKKVQKLMEEFQGYLVGGYVRDTILGRESKDIDISSIFEPVEIVCMLLDSDYKWRDYGKAYGVFIIDLGDGLEVELSAARRDYNHDGRHCDVEYVPSIEEDLARRDLTINSLAVDREGNLIDLFNGVQDIKDQIVRFVRTPLERINEDNLRAFRALRFSYQLGFTLLPETAQAIERYADEVISGQRETRLSPERMRTEIKKILFHYNYNSETHWKCFVKLLETTGLPLLSLQNVVQPLKYHQFDVLGHIEHVLRYSPKLLKLQLAALLHDTGKKKAIVFKDDTEGLIPTFLKHEKYSAEIAEEWLRKMTFPSEIVEDVKDLVANHMKKIGHTNKSKMKFINKFSSVEVFKLWGLLRLCDRLGKGNKLTEDSLIKEISIIKQCLLVEEDQPVKLNISGHDVMEVFDIKPGPKVGEYLNLCKELVYEDPSNNDKESLVAFLHTLKREIK